MSGDGWAKLGQALAGGRNDGSRRTNHAIDEVRLRKMLLEGEMKQDEFTHRQGIGQQFRGVMPEEQAALMEAIVRARAGTDYAGVMRGESERQEQGFRGSIEERLLEGDRDGAMAAAGALRPQDVNQRTAVNQGIMYDPMGRPDQETSVNQRGGAEIAALQGLLDQRRSRAALTNEQRVNPERFRSPSSRNERDPFAGPMGKGLESIIDQLVYGEMDVEGASDRSGELMTLIDGIRQSAGGGEGGGGGRVGDSPYREGTRLAGPDGKQYVVRGGVPVPVQE